MVFSLRVLQSLRIGQLEYDNMAKFIELPHGQVNPDTGENERVTSLVNIEQIIRIYPLKEFMCNVYVKATPKPLTVYRKYDTLRSQILGRSVDLDACFPDEEIAASYVAGYEKGLGESDQRIKDAKEALIAKAVEWISSNALTDNWRSRFRNDMLK